MGATLQHDSRTGTAAADPGSDPRARTSRRRTTLLAIELVTASTALGGGALLMLRPDGSLLAADPTVLIGTPFTDWFVPGLLLGLLVGVGFTVVAASLLYGARRTRELTVAAGVGLVAFELVQFALIGPHPLQLLFVGVGVAVAVLGIRWVPSDSSLARPARPPRSERLGLPRRWFWLASAGALVAAVGNVVGLVAAGHIYGRETTTLADAASAQDWVNLLVVAPATVLLGWWAYRGRLRARLLWLGCLSFTTYNYAIYVFAVHFGPLFLVWVAALGLSLFALIGGVAATDAESVRHHFGAAPMRAAGWFLAGASVLFAGLWLREIIPDLVAGSGSRSAADWKVPTNPVHVLDLAFYLPAAATAGVLLLRRQAWGYLMAAPAATWFALTCLPILVTPLVALARGHAPEWTVAGPVGLVLIASVATLVAICRPSTNAMRAAARRSG